MTLRVAGSPPAPAGGGCACCDPPGDTPRSRAHRASGHRAARSAAGNQGQRRRGQHRPVSPELPDQRGRYGGGLTVGAQRPGEEGRWGEACLRTSSPLLAQSQPDARRPVIPRKPDEWGARGAPRRAGVGEARSTAAMLRGGGGDGGSEPHAEPSKRWARRAGAAYPEIPLTRIHNSGPHVTQLQEHHARIRRKE